MLVRTKGMVRAVVKIGMMNLTYYDAADGIFAQGEIRSVSRIMRFSSPVYGLRDKPGRKANENDR